MIRRTSFAAWLSLLLMCAVASAHGQTPAQRVETRTEQANAIAAEIWDLAELGYLETESSARLQRYLADAGFDLETGVADIPTAFVASAGRGRPVIAILAEFDALPGMAQDAVPSRQVRAGKGGHACGHHLFGVGSATAAIAVSEWLESSGTAGTVRLYGTPAEEGGSAKVYMTRAGLFDDVDVVLHWHPDDANDASPGTTNANKSGRFRFHGRAAHAASAPERGRSALDGVEAMNYMVNMMREHVPQESRIHYVITDGGDAPNIVPETAEVYYYVRHLKPEVVVALFERVVAAAQGAAQGTGTRVEVEVMHGNYPVLPNQELAAVMYEKLRSLGGISYSPVEVDFARSIRTTLLGDLPPLDSAAEIRPSTPGHSMGSTDVGDVSWRVPTAGFRTATWVPGTPAHSWQAVAAGGTSIGHKGMLLAAKVLAEAAAELYANPQLIDLAQQEFEQRRGDDFRYEALLGDRDPPLDYRQ
jgi:aminobenzoyl-glutamate utilization protein B